MESFELDGIGGNQSEAQCQYQVSVDTNVAGTGGVGECSLWGERAADDSVCGREEGVDSPEPAESEIL